MERQQFIIENLKVEIDEVNGSVKEAQVMEMPEEEEVS